MRVLLIEDDLMLADALQDTLQQSGFTVDHLAKGLQALPYLSKEQFDVIVLDLTLPDIDGISLLKKIRAEKNTIPVLILTARDTLDDRVSGLDSGADDYLTKPFASDELKARLRALVRRHVGQAQAEHTYQNIVLNLDSLMVAYDGKQIKLTPYEFKLLHQLIIHPGRVFTKEQLQQAIYGWQDDTESNTIEVHIHALRKKLYPELIRNIRGVGYLVNAIS
jgi:two-component system response regulator QseB